jgi:hypothetical protein
LIDFTFLYLEENHSNAAWMSEGAILTPLNEIATKLNNIVLSKMLGAEYVLYSSNEGIARENGNFDVPVEFLNTLAQSLPPHELRVKTGAPIMMLRNLYPAHGVCNGTRLIVEVVINNRLLQAIIAKTERVVLIPRTDLKPKDVPLSMAPSSISRSLGVRYDHQQVTRTNVTARGS